MIDSHCHLDVSMYESTEEIEQVLYRARQAGITAFVNIGSGSQLEGVFRAVALAQAHADVFASAGIHPLEATLEPSVLDSVYNILRASKVVGSGEMGLDFHRNPIPQSIQEECFTLQIDWAKELGYPIIIHDRDSQGRVLEMLKEQQAFLHNRVLYHCFTSDLAHMEEIVDCGGYISIPGIVTFKNAKQMKDVAKSVPLSRLLIETDAPFLTPHPHRGKKNEPQYLVHTAQYIADLREMSLEEFIVQTDHNTKEVFALV